MSTQKEKERRRVLITGCSDNSLGSALAIAFHAAGLEVYATARDTTKMQALTDYPNIHLVRLDVQSDDSIAECVRQVPSPLDILVNNAGGGYNMPVVDLSIADAKKLFDLNVWGGLAVTQAFMPHLLASASGSTVSGRGNTTIVNHTSAASCCPVPFQGAYSASKAAMSSLTSTLRLELEPFDIHVLELKTALVASNFPLNVQAKGAVLPDTSIYAPAKDVLEESITGDIFKAEEPFMPAEEWAASVVSDVLSYGAGSGPGAGLGLGAWSGLGAGGGTVWRGARAWLVRIGSVLPAGFLNRSCRDVVRMDEINRLIRSSNSG